MMNLSARDSETYKLQLKLSDILYKNTEHRHAECQQLQSTTVWYTYSPKIKKWTEKYFLKTSPNSY